MALITQSDDDMFRTEVLPHVETALWALYHHGGATHRPVEWVRRDDATTCIAEATCPECQTLTRVEWPAGGGATKITTGLCTDGI